MVVNASWHREHPMPKRPTMDDRIRWHEEHARVCGCRPIPEGVARELRRRRTP